MQQELLQLSRPLGFQLMQGKVLLDSEKHGWREKCDTLKNLCKESLARTHLKGTAC